MSDARPCEVVVPGGPGEADGPCGTPTVLRCFWCQKPACAACTEDSWLAECSETCPDCWEAEQP